jgi:hypothetical protein
VEVIINFYPKFTFKKSSNSISVKKLSLILIFLSAVLTSSAQDSTQSRHDQKYSKKEARRQKINALIRQAEEGVLVYSKQSIFGIQFRTNGYGAFYEIGRMKTNRKTTIFRLDFNETKSPKEEKLPNSGFIFGNSFVYGKINHFYPVTLGIGQQYILGQKGNKNGVVVSAIGEAGLSLGLLRPYYVEVSSTGTTKAVKYNSPDSALFLDISRISGGAGLSKGWSEMKLKPGGFAKAAMRFDYGRFNEVVSGLEAGISMEVYSDKIPIMVYEKAKQFFFQGYISLLFGKRK